MTTHAVLSATEQRAPVAAGGAASVGLIGFLTLVDLFAAQAILPALVVTYGVTPAAMGAAVNASTFGMAVAALGVTFVAPHVDRRFGIWISLALLSIPTSLLAIAPDLVTFTALRVVQGVFMASAFALTMTWLAETSSPALTQRALAAYITGVVASNVLGRLATALAADVAGAAASFLLLAALNLAGALLVITSLKSGAMGMGARASAAPISAWMAHLADGRLRAAFAIGFLILFAFVGTFTYVNFVLVAPPIALGMMSLGLAYFVFAPSLVITPLAGPLGSRIGASGTVRLGLAVALVGLPLMLAPALAAVLAGMTLVGAGTFLAQAAATGFVARTAATERAAASGLYLASYYLGGLAGATLLGLVFDRVSWTATVAAIALALVLALAFCARLGERRPVAN